MSHNLEAHDMVQIKIEDIHYIPFPIVLLRRRWCVVSILKGQDMSLTRIDSSSFAIFWFNFRKHLYTDATNCAARRSIFTSTKRNEPLFLSAHNRNISSATIVNSTDFGDRKCYSQISSEMARTPSVKLKMSYMHNPGSSPLLGMTIGNLIDESAEKYGDIEAVVDMPQNIRKSFAQVRIEADKLGAGLMALGLQKGDRIGILGPNSYEWYLTYLAAAKMGLISVIINFTFQVPELKYCLNRVGIKALICAESVRKSSLYEKVLEVAPEIANSTPGNINSLQVPSLKSLVVMSKKQYRGSHSFEEVMDMATDENVNRLKEMQAAIQFDDPCNIQYTSGTTGLPKATLLTHHGIVNNVICATSRTHGVPNPPLDRSCITVPLFHTYGCNGIALGGLYLGSTCVMPSAIFSPSATMKAVEEEKITHIFGTPTMYVDMLSILEKEPRHLSTIERVSVAAAPCSKELINRIKTTFGAKRVSNGYGQTEASFAIMVALEDDSADSLTSTVGFPLDHLEVKVVDKEGRIVPIETPGELCVRGYTTMLEYWGDPEKTKETMTEDKWLRTGDLFVLQENGYGRIVGRVKDMIIRGGENVFPKEIEDFLVTHPKIVEVSVVGLPDPRLGEDVCAFIRLKDGETVTEEELHSFCKGKIAYYKVPRYFIFISEFPKTASGKVQKNKLVDEAAKIYLS